MLTLSWATADAYDATTHRTEQHEERVRTVVELDAALDRLHEAALRRGAPHTVEASSPSGDLALSVVVGDPSWSTAVLFDHRQGGPTSMGTVGELTDEGRSSEGFVFFFAGEYSAVGWNSVITNDDTRSALREFFVTGQEPTCIRWMPE